MGWSGAESTPGRLLVALFVLGLVPRLAVVAARPAALESWEYETLAQNVVAGQGYLIPRFGHVALAYGDGNLYAFLAATVYLIGGHNTLVLAVVQAGIAALAVPVIYAIGSRALGAGAALLAAGLTAFHPGLLAYSLKLHPLGLDVLLIALVVFWIGRGGSRAAQGLPTGLALGLSLMTRPTFFLAGLVGLIVHWRQSAVRASLVPGLAAALVVALAIAAPWLARNWVLLGQPMLVSSSMEDVWKGNNPIASGSSYLPDGQEIFAAAPASLQAQFQRSSELELNQVFTGEVVNFVRQQPIDFAALTARKFAYFWWLSPQAGLLYPASWLAAYQAYAAVILAFAAVGALAILRGGTTAERDLLGLIASIALTIALVHALAYVEGRHRWGIEPLLLLLTARGMCVVIGAMAGSHLGAGWRARMAP